jgi:hypothetical protein
LSRDALPFSTRRTSGEENATGEESSGVEPANGFEIAVSSSPLDEGEGRSLTLLGGGASRATGECVEGERFAFVEATEAAERRLFSAVAKVSGVLFEFDADPTEGPLVEEDLDPSIRDSTDSTEFLF